MALFLFIVLHWYISLFFQSVFHHRYAAHGIFSMSKIWERIFFIGSYIAHGSSYISPHTYGLMHRLHHEHTDTPEDPHSPSNSTNVLAMLVQTRNNYYDIYSGSVVPEKKYFKNLPSWEGMDRLAHNWISRVIWIMIYALIYYALAPNWWFFILLPLTCALSSVQGAIVNWWAHRLGYTNFAVSNTSVNIMRFDIFFMGEAYHNNHHKNPSYANNAHQKSEWDMGYQCMKIMDKIGIIRLKTRSKRRQDDNPKLNQ